MQDNRETQGASQCASWGPWSMPEGYRKLRGKLQSSKGYPSGVSLPEKDLLLGKEFPSDQALAACQLTPCLPDN